MLLSINISYGVVCQRASLIGKRTLHQHHRTWQMPLKPWRHCQGHSHSGLWKLPALEVSPSLHLKNKTRDKIQPSPFQPTFNFQNFTLEPSNGRTGKCPWWSMRTAPLPTDADCESTLIKRRRKRGTSQEAWGCYPSTMHSVLRNRKSPGCHTMLRRKQRQFPAGGKNRRDFLLWGIWSKRKFTIT